MKPEHRTSRRALTRAPVLLTLALLLAALLGLASWARADTPAVGRGTVWSAAAAANTDIFAADIQVRDAGKSSTAMRLTIAVVTTDSVVKVQLNGGSGPSAQTFALNDGTALTAGNLYTFQFGMDRTDGSGNALTCNVQCATATTVGYASLQEVQIP